MAILTGYSTVQNQDEKLVFCVIFPAAPLTPCNPFTLLKAHLVPSLQPEYLSHWLAGWHWEALHHIISHGIWLEWQMTQMAERRAINLKVLASIKSLGKFVPVTIKCEKKVTLKVPGSLSIFWCDKQFDKKGVTQITNEAPVLQSADTREPSA